MVAQKYRWDFIGLSTDVKPTPATSDKVVDGSTFYCSDNSKLYVYCKNNWYERKALGEGGGGTSYTAGEGIDITEDTISVDTDTIQEKLTAGSNITIVDNVISAAGGGGGGGIVELSSANFNYDSQGGTNYDTVAIWLLDDGFYKMPANYTTVPVKGALEGSVANTFNTAITSGTFTYFLKAGKSFWLFVNKDSQAPDIGADRPLVYYQVNPANGFMTYTASWQFAKKSELPS